jgi:OOP family OmpA-OmpF porin
VKSKYALLIMASLLTVLSGCATNQTSDEHFLCMLAGSVAGGGIGAAVDDNDELIVIGALVGSVVGHFLCGQDNDADGDGVSDSNDNCPGTARGVQVNSSGCPIDSDGDGVTDNNDQCPDTPRGVTVNSRGCALDSDGDGVTDNNDRCPNTPAGAKVNSSGCQLDGDGDGVVDAMDECPTTPRGQSVNEKGCHIVFSLQGVNFATNSADLNQDAMNKLEQAEQMLKENRNLNVRVEGHTDNTGDDSYNQDLSQRRAEAVVEYLVNNGISRNRMTARGYGESNPVADNSTREGRASNRRVDFAINN